MLRGIDSSTTIKNTKNTKKIKKYINTKKYGKLKIERFMNVQNQPAN